jgi:hypothetical protein
MMNAIKQFAGIWVALFAVAMLGLVLASAPMVMAGTDQQVIGVMDSRNGTITFNTSGAFYEAKTSTYSTINFTGYINGSTFIWVHNNVWKSNTTVGAGVTSINFTPGVACANWAAYWDNTSRILIFRSNMANPAPSTYLTIAGFSTFYTTIYGVLAYAFIILIPITTYFKTKSISIFLLTFLFIAAAGISLGSDVRVSAVLGIGLGIGVMIYKILWRND